jgi:hypothetical protein
MRSQKNKATGTLQYNGITLLAFTQRKPVPQEIDDNCSGNHKEKPCKELHLKGEITKYHITDGFKKDRQKNPEKESENNPGPVHTGDQFSVVLE